MDKLAVSKMDQSIADLASKCDQKILAIWASDCAERVLPCFEEKHPYDDRPRRAIEAGRAWANGKLKMIGARKAAFAAHAAARNAEHVPEARSAARSAGHAAATAHVASHALYAAIYAATAARDAANSANAITLERDWQYKHLLELGGKC